MISIFQCKTPKKSKTTQYPKTSSKMAAAIHLELVEIIIVLQESVLQMGDPHVSIQFDAETFE